MSKEKIEETNSGVKKKGDWKEISEFAEEVEEAVNDNAESESVEDFDDWRPKVEETERDVKKKTIDKAVIQEKELEKESEGVKEDLKNASGKVAEAGMKAAKKESPEKEIREASEDVAKPFYSGLLKFLRALESRVYSWFALRFNPYYLDTEDFSVDMKYRKDGDFEMDVAAPEEEVREDLQKNFLEEDDER